MTFSNSGRVVIISSPSGGGKTSICRHLLNAHKSWQFSISYTTRPMRSGEIDGREYYFVDTETFEKMDEAGNFAEHFQVHLYRYGTPRQPLDDIIKHGGVMLLDVDVQGAAKLKREYPGSMTVFILPPSLHDLRERLKARGTETPEQLEVRFRNAADEMKLWREFDYVVINDDLSTAVNEVESIVTSDRCRTDRIDPEQIENIIG